jgi:hypothetical protein
VIDPSPFSSLSLVKGLVVQIDQQMTAIIRLNSKIISSNQLICSVVKQKKTSIGQKMLLALIFDLLLPNCSTLVSKTLFCLGRQNGMFGPRRDKAAATSVREHAGPPTTLNADFSLLPNEVLNNLIMPDTSPPHLHWRLKRDIGTS